MAWWCRKGIIVINYDRVERVVASWEWVLGFSRANIPSMMVGNKDRAVRVLSLTNEEPLEVVKLGIYVVQEVVRQDCCYGSDGMIGEGKTPLRHG